MISHLESLSVRNFLFFMNNFNDCTITEKIDGANLQVGKENGNLYVARSLKGGKKYHNLEDWPNETWVVNFKQAHNALIQSNLIDYMEENDIYDLEVLGNSQPNVIDYKTNGASIVFLRTIEGTDNYKDFLKNSNPITTQTNCTWSDDGVHIYPTDISNVWNFYKVKEYDPKNFDLLAIQEEIINIISWTEQHTYSSLLTNGELADLKFNKCPPSFTKKEWKEEKASLKKHKSTLVYFFSGLFAAIKCKLLSAIDGNVRNTFGTFSAFEGFIVHHKPSGTLVKLVDRNTFSAMNSQFWHTIETLKNVKHNSLFFIADRCGLPNLAYPSIRNQLLRKHNVEDITSLATVGLTMHNHMAEICGRLLNDMRRITSIIYEYNKSSPDKIHSKYTQEKHKLFFADMNNFYRKMLEFALNNNATGIVRLLLNLGEVE